MSAEKWVRLVDAYFPEPPEKVFRTIQFDDRDNVTLTRAEIEGLLRLAGYEKEESNAKD